MYLIHFFIHIRIDYPHHCKNSNIVGYPSLLSEYSNTMFQGIKCSGHAIVEYVCITNTCKLSPFLCRSQCPCRHSHHGCEIRSTKQIDQNIKTILKFEFFIVYSPVYRGKTIGVMGRFALQSAPPPNNQPFCLTFDPIPRFGCESISFRLTKLRGCIGVGVFIRQILEQRNFCYLPDAQYLNHGAYMVMTNSMLYSHSRHQQNGRLIKKYNLGEGDIVKVRYQNGKVFFVYKYLQETADVDLKAGDHLHFGVYLYDVEDEVEIVNTFVNGEL